MRATCAIARVTMNVWDRKWLTMVTKCGVNISNYMRYMDDGRVFLFGLRKG